MLNDIFMKKGNPLRLSGHVIAYAKITERAINEAKKENSPFVEMVRNGLLAISGDFRRQRSLKDFLSDMAGDKELEELKDQLGMGKTDVEQMISKFADVERLEAIPVPSQVITFESEEQLLSSDADIYYLGSFSSLNNAHLVLSSFPILYQGFFREAEQKRIREEIDALLGEIESRL